MSDDAEPVDPEDPIEGEEAHKYPPGPINERQEHPHAQRFLAAQSRLYSEAKNLRLLRLPITASVAGVAVLAGLVFPDARTLIGAVGVVASILWSTLAEGPERRRRSDAVATQEEFDCYVYDLAWKASAVDHPSATTVAEAAARYQGDRLADWYPRTGPLPRPLDVLVCQRSNLGWGTASHRQYAAFLTGVLVVGVVAAVGIACLVDSGFWVVLPLAAPAKEFFEIGRDHRRSAETKEGAEKMVRRVWDQALAVPDSVTLADCRDIQDRIMAIRSGNASVPDWFDTWRRDTYEASMRQSTNVYIEQAIAAGLTR